MSKRVILHVGTPKTGTSYVQDVLYRNRTTLAAHGVLYPADRFDAQFLAALDLMRLPWGGLETEAVGEWKRLAGHVRRWPGTTIISHEILACATRAQAAQALADLGHPRTEVHVVVSARDLVRQIPAEWQENVKHRRTFTYTRFLRMIRDPERASQTASWFWGVQELPDILERWGAGLPPERIHVVTVPKPGAPHSLLWERFAATFGIGGLKLDLDVGRANPSLGAPETALLRRINVAVNALVKPADYRPLVRELLAHQTLSKRRKSPRLSVPPDVHAWAGELSQAWNKELDRRGYDIVGDLAELQPAPEAPTFSDPDHPRERQVNKAAVEAVRALLLENVRLREAEADLQRRLSETEAALRRSYLRPTYQLREKAVARLENGWVGSSVMKAYRRARGRSSPAA
ncbi:hypothetical protein [Nocardioides sp.]|uniref:hypothetical protein n=1 Tax=Nocardioides sp. TaxID=35761 RepID=UPI003D0C79BD